MNRVAELRLARALRRLEGTAEHLRAGLDAIDSMDLEHMASAAVASAAAAAGDAAAAAAYAGGRLPADAAAALEDLLGAAGEALDILHFEVQLGDGPPPGRVRDCIRCVSGSLDDIRSVIGGPASFVEPPDQWQLSVCRPVGAHDPASPAEAAAEAAAEADDPPRAQP